VSAFEATRPSFLPLDLSVVFAAFTDIRPAFTLVATTFADVALTVANIVLAFADVKPTCVLAPLAHLL
jgi:hypothetical protein